MPCQHPIILEILRNHPLSYVLSEKAEVPEIYVQQFWHTLEYVKVNRPGASHFRGRIDNRVVRLSFSLFRCILSLPEGNTIQNPFPNIEPTPRFASTLEDSELCVAVRQLGYTREFPFLGRFKRMYLANIWYTLFSILNRCLSSRSKGIDQCSSNFLYLFISCATNRHVDYSLILWKELKDVVGDKSKPSKDRVFLPFP